MKGLFSIDNPIWNFIGKLVDMLLLTCLWIIGSLPVITIGASTAALYTVAWKLSENKEGYLIRQFFHAFRKNFKRGTVIELIIVLAGVVLITDIRIAFYIDGLWGKMMFWALLVLGIIAVLTATLLIPLSVRTDVNVQKLLTAAFVLSLKHLGWTVFMSVSTVCLISLAVFVMAPLCILVPALTAYLHSKILNFILREDAKCYIQN